MSDFWGFVLSIAEQESPKCLAQMEAALTAVEDSQSVSIGNSDDLLPKLLEWLERYPECRRRWMTATEIGNEMLRFWEWSHAGRTAGPEVAEDSVQFVPTDPTIAGFALVHQPTGIADE